MRLVLGEQRSSGGLHRPLQLQVADIVRLREGA